MVKVKGTAHIKIYDPNKPGSERCYEVGNYVTERFYRLLYNTGSNMGGFPSRYNHLNVFIANRSGYVINKTGWETRFTTDAVTSPGLIGMGGKPASQTSPVSYHTLDVPIPFVQFYNRIDPTGVSRTFNIIGLTNDGVGTTNIAPLTILLVEPPCVQGPAEFIDVVYNLEITKGTSYYFNNQFQRDWVNYYVNNISFVMHNLRCSYCDVPPNPAQTNGYEFLNVAHLSELSDVYSLNRTGVLNPPLKHMTWVDLNPSQLSNINYSHIGFVINSLFLGEARWEVNTYVYPYYWERNPSIGTSPFQSKFNKKADALLPFWEPADTPNSSGDVVFGGTWAPSTRFPEIVKVLMVSGGSVGTATYRIQIKKFVRLAGDTSTNPVNINLGNTWDMNRGDVVPFISPANPHPRHHGTGAASPKARWKGESVIMYDMSGITLLNLFNGTFQTWDAVSTPPMNATAICQCEPVPSQDLIYVACRNTGLYRINVASNTVTLLNPDPCFGVCLAGSGKVYAVFNGRISNSDNWVTPLTLVSVGITSGNTPDGQVPSWNRVRYIKASPWDTTDKLAIIITRVEGTNNTYGNGNTTVGYVVWWSPTLGSSACTVFTNDAGKNVTSNPNAVGCHPTEDCWVLPSGCLVKWGFTTPITATLWIAGSDYWGNLNYGELGASTLMATRTGWAQWFGTPVGGSMPSGTICYATFYEGMVLTMTDLVNPLTGAVAMSKANTYLDSTGGIYEQGGTCLQVEGDLFLQWGFEMKGHYQLANLFRTHPTNNARTQGWIDYGWNGTEWVQGSTTPRTTHTTTLPLPNGITVRFVDGVVQTVPSFVPGQFILQYMCHGVLVDNTISWYYEMNRYYSDVVVQSFPPGFTVPSTPTNGVFEVTLPKYKKVVQSNTYGWLDDGTTSGIDPDPDFYAADMQSKRSFSIALGGIVIPHTSIFYLSEKASPGPMEVSIEYTNNGNVRTDRRLRFNSADAGKSITGTYVYIKCPS